MLCVEDLLSSYQLVAPDYLRETLFLFARMIGMLCITDYPVRHGVYQSRLYRRTEHTA
jgi:hypothetical protein